MGADCGSDHELHIAKFRLKLKKVGKTTRPFRYDLNHKGFDLGHTEWPSGFPYFLQFKSEFGNGSWSSWSEPQSAPGLVFADCIELLHLWLQRI